MFLEGRGLNSSYAIYQDATGKAYEKTIALGIGIGSGYLFETTFQREATSDLTGERGSLMGASQGLLLAQYEVLRENGHTPSEAFNETVEAVSYTHLDVYKRQDESILPRSIATRQAFLNAMTLDIAMGGSTNTCLLYTSRCV